jgi:hypothetical protein
MQLSRDGLIIQQIKMKSVYHFTKLICFCTTIIPGLLLFLATICCLTTKPHPRPRIDIKHEMRLINTVTFLVTCLFILPFALVPLTFDTNISSHVIESVIDEKAMAFDRISSEAILNGEEVPYLEQLDEYFWNDIPLTLSLLLSL